MNKDTVLGIRITNIEKNNLKKAADEMGLSPSSMARIGVAAIAFIDAKNLISIKNNEDYSGMSYDSIIVSAVDSLANKIKALKK